MKLSLVVLAAAFILPGCQLKVADNSASVAAMAAYCSTTKSFANGITLNGTATYQYRNDGNGAIPDGNNTWQPVVATSFPSTYTLTVNTKTGTYTCTSAANCTQLDIVNGLVTSLNSAIGINGAIAAHGMSAVDIYPTNGVEGSVSLTVSASSNLVALGPRAIRFAEINITDGNGAIVQCGETDANGQFSLPLPSDGARYTVNVMARSSNANNTAYVMNNPTDNVAYHIGIAVQSATSTSVTLQAPATGSMEGGAFNILDQIANAQSYLRAQTLNCDSSSSSTFISGCRPVTSVPMVYTYWTPGLTPNVYYGSDDPISYYLLGKSQLFIGGGADGDSVNSDMDQFDNSVIVHEYGHFIEDHFGKPNSPGGSHSGLYVIDPRLAWGEGWANFFQAAVSGVPVYRDTYGSVTCGANACATGAAFLEPLEANTPYNSHMTDVPTVAGEGNFREFSVSRVLWSIIQPSVSQFSEVWAVFNGSAGMGVVNDPFKTVARFHNIHANSLSGTHVTSWATPLTNEKQVADFSGYATRIDTSSACSTAAPVSMSIKRGGNDTGSYSTANQFTNNDFYLYNHPGGALPVSLTWSGGGMVDLDLYVYGPGYVFGDSDSILASDIRDANGSSTGTALGTTGSASVAPSLPAGPYIINVMAATGAMTYGATVNTTYTLNIGNHAACPSAQ